MRLVRKRAVFAATLLGVCCLASFMPANAEPQWHGYKTNATPEQIAAIKAGQWAPTIAEYAALGIYPGMPAPDGSVPQIQAHPAPAVRPLTASGCSDEVCIFLSGDGLTVTKWDTLTTPVPPVETFATFWADNTILATSPPWVAMPAGTLMSYSATLRPSTTFFRSFDACNTWVQIVGRPCERVEP